MIRTRFRPIAPKPQEGVNTNKEKGAAPFEKNNGNRKVDNKKIEAKKVQEQNENCNMQFETEMSLDPREFCYPDLKPMTSEHESAFNNRFSYGNTHCGSYYPNGGNIQYVGNSCSALSQGCTNPVPWGQRGSDMSLSGQQQSMNPMMPFAKSNSLFSDVSTTMKLDLDQDSVAKALGDELESTKDRANRESDGSVTFTQESAPSNSESKKAQEVKVENGSGSDADANTYDRFRTCRSQTNVADKSVFSHQGFVPCITRKSTNPLFQIEKGLACSFVSEFLKDSIATSIGDEHLKVITEVLEQKIQTIPQPLKKQKVLA